MILLGRAVDFKYTRPNWELEIYDNPNMHAIWGAEFDPGGQFGSYSLRYHTHCYWECPELQY